MKKVMSKNGSYKYIKTGFSWTTYFWGCIPSICRGDFKNAFKIFIVGILTLGIYTDIKSFTINKDYENYLMNLGYSEFGYIEEGIGEYLVIEVLAVIAKIVFRILCLLFLYIIIVVLPIASAIVKMHTYN